MPRPSIPASLRGALQSRTWPAKKALLLVHGVGNAGPGDYQELAQAVRDSLGPAASEFAVYQLFYDEINDWAQDKTPFEAKLTDLLQFARGRIDPSALSEAMLEVVGDVLWPVMSQSIRLAIRRLFIAQLQQMVLDGLDQRIDPVDMELHVIAHSLGCYHTYEALHAAASLPSHCIQPVSHGVTFKNVVLMASPVQMIRTAGRSLGSLISKHTNATLGDEPLSIPAQMARGMSIPSVDRFVSITGRLDPVGGHFSRTRADWAYMDIPGQVSIVDDQDWLDTGDAALADVFRNALRDSAPPQIGLNNPHSWMDYVNHHRTELGQWLTA